MITDRHPTNVQQQLRTENGEIVILSISKGIIKVPATAFCRRDNGGIVQTDVEDSQPNACRARVRF